MSFNAENWAWEQTCASGVAKSVLVFLAFRAGRFNGECHPGIDEIVRRTQHTERAVRKAISNLIDRGLIERESRLTPQGRVTSPRYRLPVSSDPLPISAPANSHPLDPPAPAFSAPVNQQSLEVVSATAKTHPLDHSATAKTHPLKGFSPCENDFLPISAPANSHPEPLVRKKEESKEGETTSLVDHRLVVMNAWNAMAADSGLAKITAMTVSRVRHLNARLKEHGVDGVLLAIKAVGDSDFCRGRSSSGWRADFDWLLDAVKFERAMNGGYANRGRPVEPISPITGQPIRRVHGAL